MAYAVGQTVEVRLEFDLPPAGGASRRGHLHQRARGRCGVYRRARRGVGLRLAGAHLDRAAGPVNRPGFYRLERLRVEHLPGVTHVDPPRIGFEVKATLEVVGWRLA